nr:MAG TPA_asm: hypothetical protein [Caudoviricetes sp.]
MQCLAKTGFTPFSRVSRPRYLYWRLPASARKSVTNVGISCRSLAYLVLRLLVIVSSFLVWLITTILLLVVGTVKTTRRIIHKTRRDNLLVTPQAKRALDYMTRDINRHSRIHIDATAPQPPQKITACTVTRPPVLAAIIQSHNPIPAVSHDNARLRVLERMDGESTGDPSRSRTAVGRQVWHWKAHVIHGQVARLPGIEESRHHVVPTAVRCNRVYAHVVHDDAEVAAIPAYLARFDIPSILAEIVGYPVPEILYYLVHNASPISLVVMVPVQISGALSMISLESSIRQSIT